MTVRTTRVTGQIVNPLTNRVVANKRLSVRLNPSVCYSLDGTQQIIRSSWITTDSLGFIRAEDGSLGEAFQVNADLDPAGSYYTVQVAPGLIDSLVVPYSATPLTYRSCLAANPANPNPLVAGVATINGRSGAVSLVKGDVGLGNVDNTSDAAKPVSTAQALADTAVQNFAVQRANHTGTQSADTLTDGTTQKAFLATERTQLAAVPATYVAKTGITLSTDPDTGVVSLVIA